MEKNFLRLYAITDRSWLKPDETLADQVRQAILGGASMIQFREKELTGEALREQAREVQQVCRTYGVPFIVNDDAALAKELDADGVHVGQSDMAVADARALLGPDKIVGATAKTLEQAAEAEKQGADYLGSGAIFGTTTKKDAKPMTRELLSSICESVSIPVVAIGGIDGSNVAGLKDLPIAGVAVISGIFAEPSITKAAKRICTALYGKPVVQCITNHVTVNAVANVLLMQEASPIMAHHIREVQEVQEGSSALLLNLGATDDYEAMLEAARAAKLAGHPIVIDPVGVGGSSYRREQMKKLLDVARPACIRGNFSEILAIYEDANTMHGLDDESELQTDGVSEHERVVRELARRLGCIVVASGKTDLISDGQTVLKVEAGDAMQKYVTGSGCMLSAVIAAGLSFALCPTAPLVAEICRRFGDAAAYAVDQCMWDTALCEPVESTDQVGPMTFYNAWMDRLYAEID